MLPNACTMHTISTGQTEFLLLLFTVLEACDADHLLEQFEEASRADLFREFAGGKNPNSDFKRSQIVDAVQNHFSAKAAAAGGNTSKKKPRIGK